MKKISTIPIHKLHAFEGHPYKVLDNEEMNNLTESIRESGILTPLLVRPLEGAKDEYEVISGHRRLHAAEKAGMTEVPAFIYPIDRDAASILLVDSNLHREHILPGEKAYAYDLKMKAMKRQGKRTDLTSSQVATKFDAAAEIGAASNESRDQVFRYIRLTKLIPSLLEMVDEGRIALRPAANLSYLSHDEQTAVVEAIAYTDATPSLAQTIKMRSISRNEGLSEDVILSILSQEKPNQRARISIPEDRIRKYIPPSMSPREAENYVIKALEHYHYVLMNDRKHRDER